nr:MAG TPA: hypothetical protein [Caudoviricetes sp.]
MVLLTTKTRNEVPQPCVLPITPSYDFGSGDWPDGCYQLVRILEVTSTSHLRLTIQNCMDFS